MSKLVKELENSGVGARTLFKGLHAQKALEGKTHNVGNFPVTENLYQKGLYLPSSGDLQKSQIEYILTVVEKILLV